MKCKNLVYVNLSLTCLDADDSEKCPSDHLSQSCAAIYGISEVEQTMSVTEEHSGGKEKCSEPEGCQHCQPGTR